MAAFPERSMSCRFEYDEGYYLAVCLEAAAGELLD
jgi:hypothetical protein